VRLHRCDNPACLNPDHLFIGSNKDNTQDMLAKGRNGHSKGTKHWNAKLTEDQVLQIRKDKRSIYAIAPEYGVTPTLVNRIKLRKVWKHLPESKADPSQAPFESDP